MPQSIETTVLDFDGMKTDIKCVRNRVHNGQMFKKKKFVNYFDGISNMLQLQNKFIQDACFYVEKTILLDVFGFWG